MGWQGCSKDFSQVSWPGIHAWVHAMSGQLGMSELHRFIPHLDGQVPTCSTHLPGVSGCPAALWELGKGSGSPNHCSPTACRGTAASLASHFASSRDGPLAPKPCGRLDAASSGCLVLGLGMVPLLLGSPGTHPACRLLTFGVDVVFSTSRRVHGKVGADVVSSPCVVWKS